MEQLFSVVTTIQEPTDSIQKLNRVLRQFGATLVVVGDTKGPKTFNLEGTYLLTLNDQLHLPFQLASLLPVRHYVRKNLGYLTAIKRGATCIYETDDDNAPNEHWRFRELLTNARSVNNHPWLNIYRLFSEELIWPRGFPLSLVRAPSVHECDINVPLSKVEAPIQQGLVDLSPDVDAVWRLILGHDFRFSREPSVHLPAGTCCPFNSQSTWWWPKGLPIDVPSQFLLFPDDRYLAQLCSAEVSMGDG